MQIANDVKQIIDAVVRERLSDAHVLNIEFEEDGDFEEDSVFRIIVIYDEKKGRFDAKKAAGLTRHIRSRLGERELMRFPIFRFVSQSDARKLRGAAA